MYDANMNNRIEVRQRTVLWGGALIMSDQTFSRTVGDYNDQLKEQDINRLRPLPPSPDEREEAQEKAQLELGKDLRRQMGLITPEELASMLDIQEATLMNWRMTGAGPDYVKISKRIFYRVPDIQAWMERNVRVTTRNKTDE